MEHRILIVEDDPAILRGMEMNLQFEGYKTVSATDGRMALKRAAEERVDLVVLDIMLPHVNGFEVINELRAQGSDIPIILVSAKSSEVDIVMGLELGADDYVTKPFRIAELMARVKAHLRRREPQPTICFDDIEVDLEARDVKKGGESLEMTAKEFDLLKLLIEREGRALTRETILNTVWGYGYFGTDRTVDNFVQRLRQKVDRPGEPRRILTVRGIGYRFVRDA